MADRKIGNKIKVIKSTKFPDILVITPLLPGHRISKQTKTTIKRNKLKYFWITSEGNNNIPVNYAIGLKWAEKNIRPVKYSIMIDNDVTLGRCMLDRLYNKLHDSPENIAFSYASFEFKGAINAQFPADPFELNRLIQANYISSNSMFKTEVIRKVGLVTNNKYKRLLDWAFLLKCASYGFAGEPEPRARFIAKSEPDSISSGSKEDYQLKYQRVFEDFIKPFVSD